MADFCRVHFVGNDRAIGTGVLGDGANRLFQRPHHDLGTELLVAVELLGQLSTAGMQRNSAVPPPGTMPSATAARVACRASSTRPLVCFISASVAPPTRMMATPPVSFASRSLNFSLSYSLSVCSICARIWPMRFSMSAFLPAPLMMVQLSFSTLTVLARPSCSRVDVLQLQTEILADELAAGQHGDVAEHGLAAIAEAGRLDGTHLQDAAQLVDDQGGQRLALHILGDDAAAACRPGPPSPASGSISRTLLIFFS